MLLFIIVLATTCVTHSSAQCVNGLVYADDPTICDCYNCWTGASCDVAPSPQCVLSTETNQAFLLESWWHMVERDTPVTNISSVWRAGYADEAYWGPDLPPANALYSQLNTAITRLHSVFGNANTTGKYFVMGAGGTQLTNAALYAVAKKHGHPLSVWTPTPYYYLVPFFANLNKGVSHFDPDPNQEDPQDVVQLIVAPANPVGNYPARDPRFTNQPVVRDAVFNWPFYSRKTDVPTASIVMHSMSKLSGHPGARIGWALVDDKELAASMIEYMYHSTHGVTMDAQYRALLLINRILETHGDSDSMTNYTTAKLKERWTAVTNLFNTLDPNGDNYKIESEFGFCLLWINCVGQTSEQCTETTKKFGLLSRSGTEFGSKSHVRMNLMLYDANFNVLLDRLRNMLSA